MKSFRLASSALAIGAALAVLSASGAAQAGTIIVNISAATNGLTPFTPVNQYFGPGDYTITAVGTAQGGLYNGYTTGPCTDACSWYWNFVALNNADDPNVLHFIGLPNGQSTALAALSAAQGAGTWNSGTFPLPNGPFVPGTISNPILLTQEKGGFISFNIYEADGTYANNLGGVSLRITGAGVPEPATWAMMILGLGGVGLAMRRRRRLALA